MSNQNENYVLGSNLDNGKRYVLELLAEIDNLTGIARENKQTAEKLHHAYQELLQKQNSTEEELSNKEAVISNYASELSAKTATNSEELDKLNKFREEVFNVLKSATSAEIDSEEAMTKIFHAYHLFFVAVEGVE